MTTQTKPAKAKRWLTKREAAEYLAVNERWIRRHMENGDLPFQRFGRLVRFDVADLDAYIEQTRQNGG